MMKIPAPFNFKWAPWSSLLKEKWNEMSNQEPCLLSFMLQLIKKISCFKYYFNMHCLIFLPEKKIIMLILFLAYLIS